MRNATAHTEETDPYCLPDKQLTEMLAAAPWRRFAVMGDSLSLGTGAPTPGYRDLGWSDRVANVLQAAHVDASYMNTSVLGSTTEEIVRDQVDEIVAFGPDLLHLPSGANDIVRRSPDFHAIEQTMRRMWEVAAGTGARLVTFTLGRAYVVPVFNDWHDRITRLNDMTRSLAAGHDAVVVDMWDHEINDRENLVSPDRIHFSTSGQAVMATEVVRALSATPEARPTE